MNILSIRKKKEKLWSQSLSILWIRLEKQFGFILRYTMQLYSRILAELYWKSKYFLEQAKQSKNKNLQIFLSTVS